MEGGGVLKMMFYRDDELPFIYQIKKRLLDRERKERKLKGKRKKIKVKKFLEI